MCIYIYIYVCVCICALREYTWVTIISTRCFPDIHDLQIISVIGRGEWGNQRRPNSWWIFEWNQAGWSASHLQKRWHQSISEIKWEWWARQTPTTAMYREQTKSLSTWSYLTDWFVYLNVHAHTICIYEIYMGVVLNSLARIGSCDGLGRTFARFLRDHSPVWVFVWAYFRAPC